MASERRVDMVRLERPEEVYSVEEVLGRDVKSVFPTKAAVPETAGTTLSTEAVREMLGGKKFVTESELQEIKARRGQTDDAGSNEPLKPLVEVLREAKEAKEQAFKDTWKQMKTGKNRPLDDDELAFLERVAETEAARVREQRKQEQQELEEFRRAAALAQGDAGDAGVSEPAVLPQRQAPLPGPKADTRKASKPILRAVIKPKPADQAMQAQGQGPGSTAGAPVKAQRASTREAEPAAKRPKQNVANSTQGQDVSGLAGLLGEYDSGSDT